MNRSKKEREKLRKRQSRLNQKQHDLPKRAGQAPSHASSAGQVSWSTTCVQQKPSCILSTTAQPGQTHSSTKNPVPSQSQNSGQQTNHNLADTTWKIVSMVGDENTEITDDVIEAMLNLMRAYSTPENIHVGFLTPAEIRLYSGDREAYLRKIPKNKDCLLIHPLTGHWVTTVYRKSTKTITVYDSMRTENHYSEIRHQIEILFGSDIAAGMQYVPIQQQNHLPICGGMALAFATSVLFGSNPQTLNYDISKLRQHIQKCLSSGSIQQFPVCNVSTSTSYHQQTIWKPLLVSYFDKQKEYQKQHRTNIINSQITNEISQKRQAINNDSSASRVKKFRYRQSEEQKNIAKFKDNIRKQLKRSKRSESEKHNELIKDQLQHQSKRARMSEGEKCQVQNKNRLQHQDKRGQMSESKKCQVQNKNRLQHQDKRGQMSESKKREVQNKDRLQHQDKRARMSESKKCLVQNKNRIQHQDKRGQMSESKKREVQNKDRLQHQDKRGQMSESKKCQVQNKNRLQHQDKRGQMSESKKREVQNKDRLQHQDKRGQMSESKKCQVQNKNRLQHQDKRGQMSESKKHEVQNKNRLQHQDKRGQMSESKKCQVQNKNRLQHQDKRGQMSESKKREVQNKDRLQHQDKRGQMSESKKCQVQNKNRLQHQDKRGQMSESKKREVQNKNRLQHQDKRGQMSESKKCQVQNKNRLQHQDKRGQMSESKKREVQNKNRLQHQDKRSQMSESKKREVQNKDRLQHQDKRARMSESGKMKDSATLISDFHNFIKEGPTYTCTCCFRLLYRRTVVLVNKNNYKKVANSTLTECLSEKLSHGREYICCTCHKKLLSGKIPAQAHINHLLPEKVPDVLRRLCSLEVQLITKIIPFMKIVSLPRGAQHGLKGQVVLVPANLNKITTSLPRPSSESQIIALALKRRLTDKHSVQKQYIRPNYVNCALHYLKKHNVFYKDITFRTDWQSVSEENNPDLWSAVILEDEVNEKTKSGFETTHDTQSSLPLVESMLQDNSHSVTSQQETSQGIPENCLSDTHKHSDAVIDSEDEIEEETPAEFQTGLQFQRSVNSDTCIQPVNGVEIEANDVLNLAPAEGQIPVSISKEPFWEAMAFPTLFPFGVNTFTKKEPRPTRLTAKQYVNCRLLSCDARFAESPEYTFAALDWLERETIKQTISISTRKCFQEDMSVKQLRDPQKMSKLLTENQIFAAFKSLRGSPQYFKNMHLDMLAKLRQLGPYTFFITGSAAEFHWPEVIQVVAKQYGETLAGDDIANMNWETKRNWLQRNPVTVARHIDFIFELLWGKVLLSGTHPIGQILNYDLRKEMQGRGTAHFHSAVHVLGAPVLDKDSDQAFTEFANKHISCCLPNKDSDSDLFDLVQTRQTHHHTRTCTRRKGTACRFSYPKPPTDTTVIARVPDNTTSQNGNNNTTMKNEAVNILGKMYQYLTSSLDKSNPCTIDDILSAINVSREDYEASLTISQRRTRLVMKRSPQDVYVNNYNPVILKCLRSNMDIQMITSIWACIAYITSYICKPEKTMSELMRKASKESADKNIRDKMYSIANQLRKGREVSHHEAIMRVLSIPLKRSNIPVLFISTDYRENRTRILKSRSALESLEDDDKDIYVPGIHEKYAARPTSLEHLCLAEFAANYVTASYTKNENAEDLTECDADPTVAVIKLQNNMGRMKKRQTPQIIRYHYISKVNDPEQYHHRLLLLYKPWRSEDELKVDSYSESFKIIQSDLISTIKKYEPFLEEVDRVIDDFDPEELLPEAWEQVAAQTEQEKLENATTVTESRHAFLNPENITSERVTASKSSGRTFSLTSTVKHDDAYYYHMVTSLNEKQRILFDFMYQWAVETRLLQHPPSPFYIFLSGGGGVGKTHLINTIYQGLIRALQTPGLNPDLPTVLLTASTGKAAANISGTTLHSAFALPVRDSSSKNQYRKPSPEKLNSLRASYTNLQVIIADEISMFGAQSLNNLSLCLQDIFQDYSHPFAHKSILAVGDLLQLNPVGDSPVFKPPKGGYEALAGSLWNQYFQLYELTDIVRQQGDPEFAKILSRVRVGCHTEQDIGTLKQLEQTPLESFPQTATRIVLTNEQADLYNEEVLTQFKDTVTLTATDSKRDKCTNTVPVTIQNGSLYQTGNLPKKITVAKNCAVMITKNVDIADHLVNGTIGTVEKIHVQQENCLSGTVFVKFPLECIGQAAKVRSPPNLKHCVPIEAITSSFFLAKECPVPVERKMFPLVLAFAITSHKSQGSTYEYCIADLAKSSKMRTLSPGQAYTILSRVTSRKGLLLKNFSQDCIVVNKAAVAEMERMRASSLFTWNHPLSVFADTDFIIAFLNIRSLRCHHKDLKSEKFMNKISILCISESHVKNITPYAIDGFHLFGKATDHGLAIYVKHGVLSTTQTTGNQIQVMARTLFLKHHGRLNLLLVYKQPNLGTTTFFDKLMQEVRNFDSNSKQVIGGDFNTGDDRFLRSHGLKQHIHQSTHIQGGMIDHVYSNFDTQSGVFPLPYTDHFLTWIVLPQ